MHQDGSNLKPFLLTPNLRAANVIKKVSELLDQNCLGVGADPNLVRGPKPTEQRAVLHAPFHCREICRVPPIVQVDERPDELRGSC
jgi:hypothetical protein